MPDDDALPDLALLDARYRTELRPYVTGPVGKHDQTLSLWTEAIREERSQTESDD